ncbi:MAG: ABC transporter ATP-binding protein [Anaerolineales bacterium]|nr:ABC transporter ATP-binding protein [Anaerolineales bacterium]
MTSTSEIVVAKDLVKRFGDFTAVDGINFTVRRGEIFGFLGPNGSGKTTTIRMMLGLLRPTEGSVRTLDVDVSEEPEQIRPKIGYMSQKFSLYNDLTVSENLRFYGRVYGLRNRELLEGVKKASKMAGLAGREDERTSDLSGGWRQRLALAAAIMHDPELLVLDEPTAGVDPVSRRVFWDLLYDLVVLDTTVFVTTHYMEEAEHCQRLAFIQSGKIIAAGTLHEIKENVMEGQVLELSPDDPDRAVSVLRSARDTGRLQIKEIALYGALVHVVVDDPEKQYVEIVTELGRAGIHPGSSSYVEPSLEDVFISCMR